MAKPFAPVHIAIAFEAEFSGVGSGWTDITQDILENPPPTWSRGINGIGFMDRVPDEQSFTFALRNDAGNSGGLEGYYSPGHANVRSGFGLGIRLRIREPDPNATGPDKTYGYYLKTIRPESEGRTRTQRTFCIASDWIDLADRQSIEDLGIRTNISDTALASAIISNSPTSPQASISSIESDTFAYASINVADERQSVMDAFRLLIMSTFGYLNYTDYDATSDASFPVSAGHFLQYQSRGDVESIEATSGTAAFDDDHESIELIYTMEDLVNVVEVEIPRRRIDDDNNVILYNLENDEVFLVPAGGSVTIFLPYRDPDNEALNVSGVNMINPEVTSGAEDYRMNSKPNGGGTDLAADHTVTPTFFPSSVKLVVANTGSVNSYVTRLRGRGRGIYSYGMRRFRATDSASITSHGERQRRFVMPWQSDANVGEQAAEWLLTRIGDTDTPVVQGMRLVFVANRHIDLADESYNNDLGAKVEIKDSRTGIDSTGSGEYWKLHKVTKQYIHNTLLKVTYLLKFIEPDGTFWRLGATASDDLGVDTKLGYF